MLSLGPDRVSEDRPVSAEDYVPAGKQSIVALRAAAEHCEGCALHEHATQTVFGEGRVRRPHLMLVGEQPGDQEDRTGHPFVGPAGKLLNEALEAVGLDRRTIYLTNAVKHFKWEPRGKLRLHKNQSAREVANCRPWLLAEIAAVRPNVLLCLGATAAQSLLGPSFRVTRHRGEMQSGPHGQRIVATVHPASIVRIRNAKERSTALDHFVDDLRFSVSCTFP
jgi:uracil-DNA glycosylase family protein